jgi:hypothetical protein
MHLKLLVKQEQVKPKISTWEKYKSLGQKVMKWKLNFKNTKNQWNKKLVLWKDKLDWDILRQTNQKEGEDPN